MQTIASLLRNDRAVAITPCPELPFPVAFGVELELEGMREYVPVDGWNREPDGSLRNGMEYIFAGPAGGQEAVQRINAMADTLRRVPPRPSFRCSTHIHMDVRHLELDAFARVVMAYTALESVMFDHCSMERRHSNFCQPYFVNTQLVRQFCNFMMTPGGHDKFGHLGNWPKYSGLNLRPATQHGTVEFRGANCMTTAPELLSLAQRMGHLHRLATELVLPPVEFVERLRNMELTELFPTGLNPNYLMREEDRDEGYTNALMIAGTPWEYRDTTDEGGFGFQIERPRRAQMAHRTPVQIQPTAYWTHYNLIQPQQLTLGDLYRLVNALRQVPGYGNVNCAMFGRVEGVNANTVIQAGTEVGVRVTNEFIGPRFFIN